MSTPPTRTVHVADALEWLRRERIEGASCVASLPDYSEFPGKTVAEWQAWFEGAARIVLEAAAPEGAAIFYQTDIKVDGQWVDKAFLVQRAAAELGLALLWHKIACRARPGQATFGRPGYAHVVCFSRTVRPPLEGSSADVFPELGDKVWERGMGFDVCRQIAQFIATQTSSRCVINPFCGLGSMLAVANAYGLDAIGIERSPKRAERARTLTADLSAHRFIEPLNSPRPLAVPAE